MNSPLLEELKKDFGFVEEKPTILELGGYAWQVVRMPFFLRGTYEYLTKKYSDEHSLVSVSLQAINHKSLTSIFKIPVSFEYEEQRRRAALACCEFLFSKLNNSIVQKLVQELYAMFYTESSSKETADEVFKRFEEDPNISMMLYLMDRYHWTLSEIKKYSALQLNLIVHYAKEQESLEYQKWSDLLGRHLGTTWDVDDFFSKEKKEKAPSGKVFIPLSLVIENKLPDFLKKILRPATTGSALQTGVLQKDLGDPGQVVNMATELTHEEFMDMIINHKAPDSK